MTEEREAPQGWAKLADSILVRHLKFADFVEAWAFASKVALLAEKRKHHPDMMVGYNYVSLSLTTHVAQTLTPADYKLAEDINKLPEVQSALGQQTLRENHRTETDKMYDMPYGV